VAAKSIAAIETVFVNFALKRNLLRERISSHVSDYFSEMFIISK